MKPASPPTLEAFALAIADALEKSKTKSPDIQSLKVHWAVKLGLPRIPQNSALLSALPAARRTQKLVSLLRTRLTRTASGVTPIALMPKPFPCPGKCTYCPTAIKEVDGEAAAPGYALPGPAPGQRRVMFAPKAYTGFEPATRRAIQNEFDAGRQIAARLTQYEALGQPADKCELILMGGTFLAVPKDYRNQFVKDCYDAMNGGIGGQKSAPASSLEAAQRLNESSHHRVIGLTVETRPDWCSRSQIDEMLSWGATRVELGVQSLDEQVLLKVKRGHDTARVRATTADLKNAAFKVGYHFMPGLYADRKKDVSMLSELFTNPAYCPDMLKLYPCLVMPGTELFKEWKAGRFEPIEAEEAVERIVEATASFPPWVRVMRMQRDIPANLIAAGVKAGNLHQMVVRELDARGLHCRCIRCREVFSAQRNQRSGAPTTGRKAKAEAAEKKKKAKPLSLELVERKYEASGGLEYFLSFEDVEQDLLAGFVRLRLPPESHRKEITPSTALIRELHVYGQEVEIGKEAKGGIKVQHAGLGKSLLARAEEIAQDAGRDNMVIISGVGVRPYYEKLGYSRDGPYMGKTLS
ncbi:Uncharacterised protein [uncultured archaeon]|nr:Uncharacterised protein [uncultured archaeon]